MEENGDVMFGDAYANAFIEFLVTFQDECHAMCESIVWHQHLIQLNVFGMRRTEHFIRIHSSNLVKFIVELISYVCRLPHT